MAIIEVEKRGRIMFIRMNRPERLNAMGRELMFGLSKAWCDYRDDPDAWVAILTGTGKAFCAGEDLKEAAERGTPGFDPDLPYDPFWSGELDKPVIAAVNGWAMGGGFILAARADFRVTVPEAVFEISEAKHWLLGAFSYGFMDSLPYAVAKELAMGLPLSGTRAYDVGFANRLTTQESLMDECLEIADKLLALPPASLVNTLYISRLLRPRIPQEINDLAARLRQHGAVEDIMESRRAFKEKRSPEFIGWHDPRQRFDLPELARP
jgi:enoyl-CoA hydratase/carnithine racemase